MNLTFDTQLRLNIPDPQDPGLQSLYIFNQYRAGSSVVEAAAAALAWVTGRTPNNLSSRLYDLGVSYFDPQDYCRSSVHLARDGAGLLQLCDLGGYLHYGFREVPTGFAAGFTQIAAAVLIVRDPRDIGMSHYKAVHQHSMANPLEAGHIAKLREQTASMPLEDYLLRSDTLAFLNRMALCYAPMIRAGMTVIRYEDLFDAQGFSTDRLCDLLMQRFARHCGAAPLRERRLAALKTQTVTRIANSPALKGHATGGRTGMWRDLPGPVQKTYSAGLAGSLALLGYD